MYNAHQAVLCLATDCVLHGTEEMDKARVVDAVTFIKAGLLVDGDPVDVGASMQSRAKLLIQDMRSAIPVAKDGTVIGAMSREIALGILVGTE